MKNRFQSMLDLESKSTTTLVVGLSLMFILILSVWVGLRDKFGNPPVSLDLIVMAVSFSLFGFAGYIVANRKELPPFVMILGKPAVVLGTIWAIIGWGIAGYAIFSLLFEIFF